MGAGGAGSVHALAKSATTRIPRVVRMRGTAAIRRPDEPLELEPEADVDVVDPELPGCIGGDESPRLDTQQEWSRRMGDEMTAARDIAQPRRRRKIRIFRIVQAAPRA